jgi:hypothetical protein
MEKQENKLVKFIDDFAKKQGYPANQEITETRDKLVKFIHDFAKKQGHLEWWDEKKEKESYYQITLRVDEADYTDYIAPVPHLMALRLLFGEILQWCEEHQLVVLDPESVSYEFGITTMAGDVVGNLIVIDECNFVAGGRPLVRKKAAQ